MLVDDDDDDDCVDGVGGESDGVAVVVIFVCSKCLCVVEFFSGFGQNSQELILRISLLNSVIHFQ